MTKRYRDGIVWFIGLIRAPHWWDSKLPLGLGIAYALAWRMRLPISALAYPMFVLLMAGVTLAIYASIYNDLLDEDEDRRAGKVTGIMRLSPTGKKTALGLTLAAMVLTTGLLLRYPVALGIYLIGWVIFILYSRPPVRLKARGAWGVLCVSLGEQFLPFLLAVALIASAAGARPPIPWLAAMVVFAMAFGIRSILWHQLGDAENDRISGTNTLGAKYDAQFLRRLGERYVFPVELCAFAILLALSRSWMAWAALGMYLGMEALRVKCFRLKIVVVDPQPAFRFAMLEYYQLFFPLAFLLEYARHGRSVAPLLIAQILLFPAPVRVLVSDAATILCSRLIPHLGNRAKRLIVSLQTRKSQG